MDGIDDDDAMSVDYAQIRIRILKASKLLLKLLCKHRFSDICNEWDAPHNSSFFLKSFIYILVCDLGFKCS